MRALEQFWDSVANTTTFIAPPKVYRAAGDMFLNYVYPTTRFLGSSNNSTNLQLPQLRTIYLYLNVNITASVNVRITGIGTADPSDPFVLPKTATIVETIAVQNAGKYESTNYYERIDRIEVLGALTEVGATAATLSAGLGSKGYMPYFTADYNSGSPMHYALQVDVNGASSATVHQGLVCARNPVTYASYTPIGLELDIPLRGWPMYASTGTSVLISSLDNYTASVSGNIVGALAPISILWVGIDDPAIDEEDEPSPQEATFLVTFLQQGIT